MDLGGGEVRELCPPNFSQIFRTFFEGNHLLSGIVQQPQGCSCVVGMESSRLSKIFFGPLFLNFLDLPLQSAKYVVHCLVSFIRL